MKVYLAARFGDKELMREHRDRLREAGHEVTSQWLDVEHSDDSAHKITDADREGFAQMDVNDVLRSDVLLAFSHERKAPNIGGGRHVEFGIALAVGIPVIVVGPYGEHIFHYLPGVHHVEEFNDVGALLAMPALLGRHIRMEAVR